MGNRQFAFLLPVALLVFILASGCASQGGTQAPPPQNNPPPTGSTPQTLSVNIQNFAFSPTTVSIKAGDTVKWTNSDSAPHTISASGFSSQNLNTGDSYSRTFAAAGTYDYVCGIHPNMKGTVIVQ